MANFIIYQKKDTWIHQLSGVTKLIFFLVWSIVAMVTYDTRVLFGMCAFSILIFAMSKTSWKQVSTVVSMIAFFLVMNVLAIFLFSPYQGVKIYGTRTDLFHIIGSYTLTKEQLFYEFNVILKYFTVIPAVLMFIVATNPSEFAASLNKIGISYSVAYAVAIALRYIPDVQEDFQEIKTAQQARGIDMSNKEKLSVRIKKVLVIIFPLIFSSMDRIEVVSNAMELRGFGKNYRRTWYTGKKMRLNDYLSIIFVAGFAILAIYVTFQNGSRFYNPFQ